LPAAFTALKFPHAAGSSEVKSSVLAKRAREF
jgi:hypothetical protein